MLLTTPAVNSINLAGAPVTDASTVSWTVKFNEAVSGVDPTDFSLIETGTVGATLTQVTGNYVYLSTTNAYVWQVTASGVTGNGTLGLNLNDNNSIVDSANVPLGGPGLGNGNFTGQVSTIDHTDPYVVSINLGNPSYTTTNANSVSFTTTFSAPVTGVDLTDFSLVKTGTVSATLTQVTPVNSSVYTVSVSGVTGAGTLGLNLVDNGTIHDLAGNPLMNPSPVPSFSNAGTYGSGSNPESVVVGDFNGDGKPDLAVANYGSNSVSVFLGNGNGTFKAKQTYATGTYPESVALANLNGDGNLDLIVANRGSSNISVLLGNGNGTFKAQQTFATEGLPSSVAVGDLNGDGKQDIVVTTDANNTVDVLLGIGNGSFLPFQSFATGNAPYSVKLGDVNGDGRPDILVTDAHGGGVSLLLGNGDGTFHAKQDIATGPSPVSAAFADLNGDGNLDIIDGNIGNNTVSVLLGNGNGTFQPQQTYATGNVPIAVTVGDVNGDSYPDIIVANRNDATVGVLSGNGDGTFGPQVTFATQGYYPLSVATGDFSGDGRSDIVVVNQNPGYLGGISALGQDVTVLTNSGNGNFTGQAYTIAVNYPPTVITQPVTTGVLFGSVATFTAAASGSPAPTVQWQNSVDGTVWNNIAGATSTTYSFAAQNSDNGTQFRAVFTNSLGTATSNAATLNVAASSNTGVDLGGLRFQSTTAFVVNNGHYTTSSPVQVGFTPASGGAFVPLMQLTGQVDIDSGALAFSATGTVNAIVSGTPIILLSGGISTSISSLIGAGVPGLSGSSFQVAGINFTLNSIAFSDTNNTPEVQLQGSVALLGMTIAVDGSNYVNISSSGVDLTGVDATVNGGSLQMGALIFSISGLQVAYTDATSTINVTGSSSVTVAGMGTLSVNLGAGVSDGLVVQNGVVSSFDALVNGNFTTGGVTFNATGDDLAYTSATNTWGMTGTSTVSFAGVDSISVTFGVGQTPGLTLVNGTLENLDLTANSTFHVGGVAFTANGLVFTYQNLSQITSPAYSGTGVYTGAYTTTNAYSAANYLFSMSGSANVGITGVDDSLSVTFGNGTAPGILLSNGNLERLNLVVNSTFHVGSVAFTANSLGFAYQNTSQTLVGSNYTGTYDPTKYQFAMTGSATVGIKGVNDSLSITFGVGATPGMLLSNGNLESLNLTVNSTFHVGGVAFTVSGLSFTYQNTSQTQVGNTYTGTYNPTQYQFGMTGNANVGMAGVSDSLSVQFGQGSGTSAIPGLVVSNGNLESLDLTVNSVFHVGGVAFAASGLVFTYQNLSQITSPAYSGTGVYASPYDTSKTYSASNYQFTMVGSANVGINGVSDSLSVMFGYGTTPGILVSNGNLESLNLTVNSNFHVGGLAFNTNGLDFTYQNTSQTQVGGTYTGTYDSSQYQFAMTGSANVGISGFDDSLSVTFGSSTTPGLLLSNGNLEGLNLTVNSTFHVGGVAFTANGLSFTYQNTSQKVVSGTYTGTYDSTKYIFAVSGSASLAFKGVDDSLNATFGQGSGTSAIPGLIIYNGHLESLDLTVNSNFHVAGATFTANGLAFAYQNLSQVTSQIYSGTGVYTGGRYTASPYSASNYQFTMSGSASVQIAGMDPLSIVFGHYNNGKTTPGLIINQGNLESLDATVHANFKVGDVLFAVQSIEFTYQNLSQITSPAYIGTGIYTSPYDATKTYRASNYQFSLSGSASVTVGGMGQLSVTFGHGTGATATPGLVVSGGDLQSLDATVTGGFNVGALTFGAQNLEFTYQNLSQITSPGYSGTGVFTGAYDTTKTYSASNYQFTMSGTAGVTVAGMGQLSLTLGRINSNGITTPGLTVIQGNVESLDATVNSNFTVGAVVFAAQNLEFTYQNLSQITSPHYSGSGVYTSAYDTTKTYSASNYQFMMAGTASVMIAGMGQLSVTLGHTNKNGTTTPGVTINQGDLESLDMTVNANFTVGSVLFGAQNLEFTYQNLSQITNPAYSGSGVYTSAYDTTKTYSASNYQFMMTGTAFVTIVGMGQLSVTFGHTNSNGTTSPGLTINQDNLESLDLTVNAGFTVGSVMFGARSLEFTYQNLSQITNPPYSGSGVYTSVYDTRRPYVSSNYQFMMSGTAFVTVAGMGQLSVTFGHTNSNGKTTPGLTINQDNLESLDVTVNADFTVGSVKFGVQSLEFTYQNLSQITKPAYIGSGVYTSAYDTTKTYNSSNYQFMMSGTAYVTIVGMGQLSVTFGHTNSDGTTTPGLTINQDNLESLDVTVNAAFMVGSVKFGAQSLEFTYQNLSQITTPPYSGSGVYTYAYDTTKTYSASNYQFMMSGTAYVNITGMGQLSVTFGHTNSNGTTTPGLTINQDNLESLDLTVNADFKVGSVLFGVQNLEFTYQNLSQITKPAYIGTGVYTSAYDTTKAYNASNYQFMMSGTAYVKIVGMGQLSVTFGHTNSNGTTIPGLTINQDNLESLDVTVNADFKVSAVLFGVKSLEFTYQNLSQITKPAYSGTGVYTSAYDTTKTYDASNYQFTMSGTAYVTIVGMGQLSVTFGHLNSNGTTTPGLTINQGNLENLDVTVNADFKVSAVLFGVKDLEFTYQNTSQIGGSYNGVGVYTGIYDTTKAYNGSNYVFSMSGSAVVTVLGMGQLSVTFGHGSGANATPGLVIANGDLESLDLTVNATVRVSVIVFTAKDLEFKYQNTSQTLVNGIYQGTYDSSRYLFSMSGSATVSIAFMANITVQFGHDGMPGLVIQNGNLVSLDLEVMSDISLAGMKLAKADLGLVYTASNDTYILYGNVNVNLGFGQLQATLGGGTRTAALSSPNTGVVITHGVLQHFYMTLNGSLGFGSITFAKATFTCSYQAGTYYQPEELIISGHTSFGLGSTNVTVDLGLDGLPGLVIRNGHLYSLNFKVHANLKIFGLGLGSADLTVTDNNGIFDLVGSAHLTLSIDIPSALLILGLSSTYSIDLASFTLTLHDDSNHPHDDISFTQFNVTILGATVGVRVGFGGTVNVDFGPLFDEAAQAVSRAAQAVVDWFSSLFGQLDGATLYYDPTDSSIVNGVVSFDPNKYYSVVIQNGAGVNFQIPGGATSGRLVLFGGVDTSTGLPNNIVLTAPFNSRMITPFTTLLNSLIDGKGTQQTAASDEILQVLGLPANFSITNDPYLALALQGSAEYAGVFGTEVQITSLVNLVAAMLNGLPNGQGATVSKPALGSYFFSALADAVDAAARQGVTLDLSNKATILTLVEGTAARAGISLTSPAVAANINGEASVASAVISSIIAVPVAGTSGYMSSIVKVQGLAEGAISNQFAKVTAGSTSINSVVTAYTGSNLANQITSTAIGDLNAPLVQVSDATTEVTGSGPAMMQFTVSLTGTVSPLLPVSVTYTTVDQTATVANGDYQQTQGTLTWATGDTSPKTITVPVYVGSTLADSKFFAIQLSATDAAVSTEGIGTITYAPLATATNLKVSTQSTSTDNTVVLDASVMIPESVGAIPDGTVTFYDGSTPLGTVDVDDNGKAEFSTDQLLPGAHSLTAVYNGGQSQGYGLATSTSAASSLNIGPISQTITFGPIPDQVYVANSSTLALSASSSSGLPVSFTVLSGPATIDSNGQLTMTGTGQVVVEATQAGDENTAAATPVVQQFNVNKPTLTVMIDDQSIYYGQDPASLPLTYSISGFVGTDTIASLATLPTLTTAPDGSNVGTYAITGVVGTDPNYNFQFDPGTLTILPAPLSLTVNDQTAVYGSAIPQLTYSLSGFVNGDTIASLTSLPVLSTVSAGSDVGQYAITATGASAPNYAITAYEGDLSITPAPLTITATNQTITYGTAISNSVSYTGFVNGDTAADLTTAPTVGISDGNNHVGTHPLVAANATDPDYNISYAPGTLTVNPASLLITADNQTQIIGRGTPSFGLTYSGFVNGDSAANLSSLPLVLTPFTGAVGTYPITVGGATSTDYQITYQPGTFTVILDSSTVSLSSSITDPLMGDTPTYTASVQSAIDGTTLTTGTVQFQIDGVNQGGPVPVDTKGNASFTVDPLSTGSHTITAVYSGDVNISGTTQTLSQFVAQFGSTTGLVSPTTQLTYGQNATYSVSIVPDNAPDGIPAGTVQFMIDGVAFGNPVTVDANGNASSLPITVLSAGSHLIEADYMSSNGFQDGSDLAELTVQTADQTINFGVLPNATNGDSPITLTATASSGLPIAYSVVSGPATVNGNVLTISGSGAVVVEADQAGNSNFNAAQPVQQTMTVNAAPTTTTVVSSNANSTYGDQVTVTATVAAVGADVDGNVQFQVDGVNLGGVVTLADGSASVSLPSNLTAGTHAITANFIATSDFASSVSATLNQNVARANATIVITGYDVTYDGQGHLAIGTATGVDGSLLSGLDLSATANTNAGQTTDKWTFTDTTGNYNNSSGTVGDVIEQAIAAITVTPLDTMYNGVAQTAFGTATGVGGIDLSRDLVLSGTTHTNAGEYDGDVWSFHDPSGNYADERDVVDDDIAQANATINVTPYNTTYNGVAQTATGTATGVAGIDLSSDLTLTATTQTNAGTYNGDPWFFHDPAGNYADASGDVNDVIGQATATINVTAYNTTYDGTAHTATATATGIGGIDLSGDLSLSSTTHTEAGTYNGDAWTFLDPSGNYASAGGTVNDVIGQATATIRVMPYNVTYDSTAQTALGTATGVGGIDLSSDLTLSGTTHTNAGTYSDSWTFHDPSGDYADASGTVSDVIGQAAATIFVTAYNTAYDGNAHTASSNVIGFGGVELKSDLILSGTKHTNAGTYIRDTWSFHDPAGNYSDASGTVDDLISSIPVITIQPTDVAVLAGATVIATVAATGAPTVQWQLSTDHGVTWSNIVGATSTTLSFTSVAAENGYEARALFTNAFGTATTNPATLTIISTPVVTIQPTNKTVIAGAAVSVTVAATGSPTPTVQWQLSTDGGATWNNIPGATSTTLSFTSVAAENGNQARAVFTNSAGSVTTNAATLTVNSPPVVTTQPTNVTVAAGTTVTVTAAASGAQTVQWQYSTDGGLTWNNIIGATSDTLSFLASLSENGFKARAVFSNAFGSVTSNVVTLTVT